MTSPRSQLVTRVLTAGLARGAAAALILVAAGGCSTTPEPVPGAAPGGSTGPSATGATVAGAGQPCAWATRADKATLNIAYPDTGATYWAMSYVLAPGERLLLDGEFPTARYISFITYGRGGGASDVLTDRDIDPDPGSTNPFRPDGGAAGPATTAASTQARHYAITVTTDEQTAANTIRAAGPSEGGDLTTGSSATGPSTGSTGTTGDTTGDRAVGTGNPATDPSTSAPDGTSTTVSISELGGGATPLGSGTAGAPGVTVGTLIYRVYLSHRPGDPAGGAGLPAVRVVAPDGTATAVPTCPAPGMSAAAVALVNANGPATGTPAPAQPIFIRPAAGAARLYPNPDNVYVATIIRHEPGRIVVVRGRAPTFPDTARGASPPGAEQVRYWSMCTNEYRKPYPVTACAADQDVPLDPAGNFTFVISTPADRPANATPDNGVAWLDWGDTSVDGLLLFRHMLADPGFAQSAINLAPGSLASTSMGPYAPRGTYCTAEAFARGGAAACPGA